MYHSVHICICLVESNSECTGILETNNKVPSRVLGSYNKCYYVIK
jgi:hypothetical protein